MNKEFEFISPTRIIFGKGGFRKCGVLARELGNNALVITGSGKVSVDGLRNLLRAEGIKWTEYRVKDEPNIGIILDGIRIAKDAKCDHVICLGGGSVMDAGKAVAAMMTNPGNLMDYLEVVGKGNSVNIQGLPVINIPTTAGTGSEITRNSVILVPEGKVKVSMRGKGMVAAFALIDPELSYSLSPETTATTGMDALTQVIEAYMSNSANPISDAYAIEGIRRGAESVLKAFQHGRDEEARENMVLTALFSGIALSQAGLGAVHGFASVIGGLTDAPHGAICACLLSSALRANFEEINKKIDDNDSLIRFSKISQILTGTSTASPQSAIQWIRDLCKKLEIKGLSSLGVKMEDFDSIVQKAVVSSSMKKNPVILSEDALHRILNESWDL
jgi:alcohol dehydrogenase class IV